MSTIIYGQARSGTTALFLTLHAQSPRDTVPLFEPPLALMWQQCQAPTALVKSLVWSLPGVQPEVPPPAWFQRRYVLVRDPRDRLLSALLFLLHWDPPGSQGNREQAWYCRQLTHMLQRNEQQPGWLPVHTFFVEVMAVRFGLDGAAARSALADLQAGFLAWEAALPAHTLVRYEALIQQTPCVTPRAYAWIRRSASMGEWRHWFTPADCAYFAPLLQPYMTRFHYGDDWSLASTPRIDAATSSRYVTRWQRLARQQQGRVHAAQT